MVAFDISRSRAHPLSALYLLQQIQRRFRGATGGGSVRTAHGLLKGPIDKGRDTRSTAAPVATTVSYVDTQLNSPSPGMGEIERARESESQSEGRRGDEDQDREDYNFT